MEAVGAANECQKRLEVSQRLDHEIRELARARNELQARIASRLLMLRSLRGHALLGYPNLVAYARDVLGYSQAKTTELLELTERLAGLPLLREAFERGELPWTKARTAAKAAERDPAGETLWLERARTLTNRKLEALEAEARGAKPSVRIVLELTPEEHAQVDEAAQAIMKERPGENLSYGAAVAEVCRRALTAGAQPLGGPRHRIVLTTCASCERTTRQSPEGPVEVTREKADAAACDAEVFDARKGRRPRVTRTIPPSVANLIDARDQGRCRVPGCQNRRGIERHHEGGRRVVGHDPARMLLLCDQHHAARHRGELEIRIEGNDGEVRFLRVDGTPIGNPSREGPLVVAEDVVGTAIFALRQLDVPGSRRSG